MKRHERINRGIFSTITTEVDTTKAPCKLMPEFWDAPRFVGPRILPADRHRTEQAAAECHTCPQLTSCLRFLAGWSHPDGVVAGQVWVDGVRVA